MTDYRLQRTVPHRACCRATSLCAAWTAVHHPRRGVRPDVMMSLVGDDTNGEVLRGVAADAELPGAGRRCRRRRREEAGLAVPRARLSSHSASPGGRDRRIVAGARRCDGRCCNSHGCTRHRPLSSQRLRRERGEAHHPASAKPLTAASRTSPSPPSDRSDLSRSRPSAGALSLRRRRSSVGMV